MRKVEIKGTIKDVLTVLDELKTYPMTEKEMEDNVEIKYKAIGLLESIEGKL